MGYNSILKKDIADPGIVSMLEKQEKAILAMRSQIEFTKEYDNLGVKAPQWQEVSGTASRAYARFVNTIDFVNEVQGLEIYADPLLEKVFTNLFDNAFRHGEGVTRITISCAQQGNDLLLFFEDNGPGIPPGEKDRIFIRGFGRHTGLGLFLAKEILAITRINIREVGEYRNGARFELHVPEGSYRFRVGSSEQAGPGQEELTLPVFFDRMIKKG